MESTLARLAASRTRKAALAALLVMGAICHDAHGQSKVFFDVKTKMVEKVQLAPIKAVTEYLLIQSEWAGIAEYGSEFALWLKHYKRDGDENRATLSLDLELRKPEGFREGILLAKNRIEVAVVYDEEPPRNEKHSLEVVMRQLKINSKKTAMEFTALGERVVDTAQRLVAGIR
jgi:hypothetical protein